MSSDDPSIQAALDAAQKRIREAATAAIDPAASALKTLARTASPGERAALTQALAQLLQSAQPLLAAFEKALREAVEEEVSPKSEEPSFRDPTDWMAVGLVDEDKFEDRLTFERVGQFIAHECEAELRELSAYTGEMLNAGWADPSSNPLRGNVVGAALSQAIEAIIQGGESRRVLVKELGQALAKTLPSFYRGIIEDLAARGFRQIDLTVRATPQLAGRVGAAAGANAATPGLEAMRELWEKSIQRGMPVGATTDAARAWEESMGGPQGGRHQGASGGGSMESPAVLLGRLLQGSLARTGSPGTAEQRVGATETGSGGSAVTDADLMRLLRRLNGTGPAGHAEDDAPRQPRIGAMSVPPTPVASTGAASSRLGGLMAPNMIRAHRDELVQASSDKVDHMVIEVVASLFDHILADPYVASQIAREIARLQLPVLRVAMRDPSFFSSRKHPVRRFINRISTLATSFGDLESGPGKELLGRVNALVTEIVDGDFDQVPLYVRKLGELEQFIAAKARAEFESSPAAATLQAKEAEWQLAQRFGGRLQEAFEPLPVATYLKEFLAGVWSRAIVAAAQDAEADPAREKRFRRAAFYLISSVQPKRSIEQRNQFLAGLRGLTATLDEGLALIAWPKEAHDAFFGKLIADQANSLKATAGSELDHNMLMRQLDAAARTPLPDAEVAGRPAANGPGADAFEPAFSLKEAQRVGLLDEAAVDWSSPAMIAAASPGAAAAIGTPQGGETGGELDLDLATRPAPLEDPTVAAVGPEAFPAIGPLPAAEATPAPSVAPEVAEPEEPTEGAQLRQHLQVGVSYVLQLKTEWEKVRLTHMNASRTFFLFTHGAEDRGTISMTARMLGRLCEARRLKAFEDKPLIDRATERVRTQAVALRPEGAMRPQELSTA
jgi:hypothetical protein